MKTKSFLLFSTSVFAISLFLIVFHSQPPQSFQTIVTQTSRQIKDFQVSGVQENLRDVEESHLVGSERFARVLGLAGGAAGAGGARWTPRNTTLPALVTHARADQHAEAVSFVRAAARLPYTVLLYNLGLKPYSLAVVQSYCNSSKCAVIDLDLSEFPSHVSDESIHAFRPLVIQHALSRVGGVIFCETSQRWAGSAAALAELWARAAAGSGAGGAGGAGGAAPPGTTNVVAWTRRAAVTSLTHPRMFHYLHASTDDFLFVPMVEGSALLVADSPSSHQVMVPWIRCALTLDCIMPIGAQSGGCRFDKKPQYRYSGCHGQDASALSIILGLRAGFEESRYAVRPPHSKGDKTAAHWRTVTSAEARAELATLERNSTEAEPRTDRAASSDANA